MTAAAGTIEIFGHGFAGSLTRHRAARPPNLDSGLPIRSGARDQLHGDGHTHARRPVGPSRAQTSSSSGRRQGSRLSAKSP